MRRVSLLLGAAVAVAGCGASTAVTRTVTATRTVTRAHRTRPRVIRRTVTVTQTASSSSASAPTPAAGPSGGSTLSVHDFSGSTLHVSANGVVDPASPVNADFAAKPGDRLVAVQLTLANGGPGTISSDADANATVVGSDGQDYTPAFDQVTGCTNFNNGSYTLLPAGAQRGCVVFELPDGVSVSSLQFSLGNGTAQFNNG